MTSFGDWISDDPAVPSLNLVLDRYVVSPEFFRLYEIPSIREDHRRPIPSPMKSCPSALR